MLAADCANVGLFCKAICCSSSRVMVFCSEAGVCAWPGIATANKIKEKQNASRRVEKVGESFCTDFSAVVGLFIFVLHARHVHLHWLIAFLLFRSSIMWSYLS